MLSGSPRDGEEGSAFLLILQIIPTRILHGYAFGQNEGCERRCRCR